MRYQLHDHPAFPEPLSKEDLYLLVQRGSLARGDLCRDIQTGRDHVLGEIIGAMRPPRAPGVHARVGRPAYQEFQADVLPADDVPIEARAADAEPDPEANDTGHGDGPLHLSHPSWLAYLKALFLCLLLVIASVLLFILEGGLFLLTAVAALGVFCAVAIARFSRDYIVTEERVEVIWGILGRSSKEVLIGDIRSIDVHHRGFKGAFLGLGTVDFSSAANAGVEVQFQDTRAAHRIKDLVRQLQAEHRQR
jgi:membrane protein YdbS with pleckstrin-like domain